MMLEMKCCPICGEKLTLLDGLEGIFCSNPECTYHDDTDISLNFSDNNTSPYKYEEERLKKLRGVPHHSICMGSETKGRIMIMIPTDATVEESKAIIDNGIEFLKYMQSRVKEENLDIFSTRGKKNE